MAGNPVFCEAPIGQRFTISTRNAGPIDVQTGLPGSGSRPLSKTLWVDPATTTPISYQNGTDDTPFATITAALAVATDRTTIMLQSYDYTSEGALVAPAIPELCLQCIAPGLTVPTLGPLTATGVVVSCFGIQFVGDVSCYALWCQFNAGVYGDVTAPNAAIVVDQSYFYGVVTTSWLSAIHSDVYGGGTCANVYALSSGMPDSLNVTSYVEMRDCWWDPGGGIYTFTGAPGQVILDGNSNYSWRATGQSISNGAVSYTHLTLPTILLV